MTPSEIRAKLHGLADHIDTDLIADLPEKD